MGSISLILGIVAACILVVYGIGMGNLNNFIDMPSVYITIGGTFATIMASFPLRVLSQVPKHLKIAFFGKKYDTMKYIDTLVDFAQVARRSGLLALEEKANQETDPFLKESILLIVDAVDPDKVRQMLEANLDNMLTRHEEGIAVYEKGAALGPAFGMIGTLIGLINMLKSLDVTNTEASSALGDGMSVALVTTFYGSVLANVVFLPIASQLKIKSEEEYLCKSIIVEGVLSIQAGENPRYINEKLVSLLERKKAEQRKAASSKPENA
jgi:chemotaxis protein MotA